MKIKVILNNNVCLTIIVFLVSFFLFLSIWGILFLILEYSWAHIENGNLPLIYYFAALLLGFFPLTLLSAICAVGSSALLSIFLSGKLRRLALIALAVALGYSFAGLIGFFPCNKIENKYEVSTYLRQLNPGMSARDVAKLFPRQLNCHDEPDSENNSYPIRMNKRYSSNPVARKMVFFEPQADRQVTVYFDANDMMIGIELSGSSSPNYKKDE
jgi:hypothetical protein